MPISCLFHYHPMLSRNASSSLVYLLRLHIAFRHHTRENIISYDCTHISHREYDDGTTLPITLLTLIAHDAYFILRRENTKITIRSILENRFSLTLKNNAMWYMEWLTPLSVWFSPREWQEDWHTSVQSAIIYTRWCVCVCV